LSAELLGIAVNVDFDLVGIVEYRGLPLLHGQRREQIVGRERDGVVDKTAALPRGDHCPIDGLWDEGDAACGRRNSSGEGEVCRGDVDVLTGHYIGGGESGNKGQILEVRELARNPEHGAVKAEIGRIEIDSALAIDGLQGTQFGTA